MGLGCSRIHEGHEGVASSTVCCETLVKVSLASWEDEVPANVGIHVGAVVPRVANPYGLKFPKRACSVGVFTMPLNLQHLYQTIFASSFSN